MILRERETAVPVDRRALFRRALAAAAAIGAAATLPAGFRPAGEFPCNAEGVGLALLYLIIDQDRSLTSPRTANQPVGAYLLDLYGQCLRAVNGERGAERGTVQ